MTTREQIISAAKSATLNMSRLGNGSGFSIKQLERFYAIAFEAGRVAEREENVELGNHYLYVQNYQQAIRARGESK